MKTKEIVLFIGLFISSNWQNSSTGNAVPFEPNFNPSIPSATCDCPQITCPLPQPCFNYDPRFQAMSVQEAIVNFPDLTAIKLQGNANLAEPLPSLPPPPAPQPGPGAFRGSGPSIMVAPGPAPENPMTAQVFPDVFPASREPFGADPLCQTDECRACSAIKLQRLTDAGVVSEGLKTAIETRMKLEGVDPAKCTSILNSENYSPISNSTEKRSKRQANLNSKVTIVQPDIGERIVMSSYVRGSRLKDSNFCGLCSFAWVFRRLPDGYTPQWINELICTNSTKCVGDYGQCHEGKMTVVAFKRVKQGQVETNEQLSLPIGNYCDCQLKYGSALQNLIEP